MAGTFQPLSKQFPIVDENGQPTEYFIRWAQQRQIDIGEGISGAEAEKIVKDWAKSRSILAGDGLSGGGTLDADVTLSLDATLGDLNDVDFSTPPANEQVMVYDEATGLWKPADQSGGGGGAPAGEYKGPWVAPNPPGIITFDSQTVPTDYDFRKGGNYQTNFGFVNAPDAVAGTTYSLTFPGARPITGGASTGCVLTVSATDTDNVFRFRAWVQLETGYDAMVVQKNGTQVIWETGVQAGYKDYTVTLDAPGVPVDIYIGVFQDGVGGEGFQNVRISRMQVPTNDPSQDFYKYSDTVSHDGSYWFCAQTGTADEPGASTNWLPFNQDNGGGGGGGGGGGMAMLAEYDLTGVSIQAVTGVIGSAYKNYLFEFSDVYPSSNNAHVAAQLSTNNGSTWIGSSEYDNALWQSNQSNYASIVGGGGRPAFRVGWGMTNNTENAGAIDFKLFSPLKNGLFKGAHVQQSAMASDGNFYNRTGGFRAKINDSCNAIRFFMADDNDNASGTFAQGTLRVWGL